MSPRRCIDDKPADHNCENCGKHRASMWWIGDGGGLALSRFYMQAAWCKCCTLKAQVKHARQLTKKLPSLEKKLAAVKCKPRHA
jgi:hypothetical protein